ncbi:MAG: diguanylate cyclase [Motiliproteus sp.]
MDSIIPTPCLEQFVDTVGARLAVFEKRSDLQFFLVLANQQFHEIINPSASSGADQRLQDLFNRDDIELLEGMFLRCLETGLTQEIELSLESKGEVSWWRMLASSLQPASELAAAERPRVLLNCIDITETKRRDLNRERMLLRFEQAIDAAYDGIMIFDSDNCLEYCNHAAESIFGYAAGELHRVCFDQLIPVRLRAAHNDYVREFYGSEDNARLMEQRSPVSGLCKDGSEVAIEININKLQIGDQTGVAAIIRNITRRTEMIEELRRAAFEDPLTGIYNRRHMSRILHRELQRAQRFDRFFSVVMIDLDHFKRINDTYGHGIGDELLMSFVSKVSNCIRSVDVFGRWGGEEFILILPETCADDAVTATENVRKQLNSADAVDELYGLTASYGVTEVLRQETSIENILERADKAMYKAKADGRDCVRKML